MRKFIKDTWLAGLMLFSFLKIKKGETKAVEVIAEDYNPDKPKEKLTINE